jgi:hypothetical protein
MKKIFIATLALSLLSFTAQAGMLEDLMKEKHGDNWRDHIIKAEDLGKKRTTETDNKDWDRKIDSFHMEEEITGDPLEKAAIKAAKEDAKRYYRQEFESISTVWPDAPAFLINLDNSHPYWNVKPVHSLGEYEKANYDTRFSTIHRIMFTTSYGRRAVKEAGDVSMGIQYEVDKIMEELGPEAFPLIYGPEYGWKPTDTVKDYVLTTLKNKGWYE